MNQTARTSAPSHACICVHSTRSFSMCVSFSYSHRRFFSSSFIRCLFVLLHTIHIYGHKQHNSRFTQAREITFRMQWVWCVWFAFSTIKRITIAGTVCKAWAILRYELCGQRFYSIHIWLSVVVDFCVSEQKNRTTESNCRDWNELSGIMNRSIDKIAFEPLRICRGLEFFFLFLVRRKIAAPRTQVRTAYTFLAKRNNFHSISRARTRSSYCISWELIFPNQWIHSWISFIFFSRWRWPIDGNYSVWFVVCEHLVLFLELVCRAKRDTIYYWLNRFSP